MATNIRVVGQKFYAKLNNGNDYSEDLTDFSQHLKGGVLEEVRAVFNVQIGWTTALKKYTYIYDQTSATLSIEVTGLDWINQGFSIGDEVKFSIDSVQTSPVKAQVKGIVTSITNGEILLGTVTEEQGTALQEGILFIDAGSDDYLTGITKKTALKYEYGLIENNEPINFLSKLTNENLSYLFEGINHDIPNTFVDGVTSGNNKAGYSGYAKVAFVQNVLDKDYIYNELTTQEFQIEHTFKINPFYRDGEIDSLKGTDKPPLDIFNGDASLKYVFQTEFRTVLSNPNTSMISSYDTQLGSVGYLDESFNGFKSDYSVDNLVYSVSGNVVDRLEVGSLTTVSFSLMDEDLKFRSVTPLIMGHTSVVDSLDYSYNTKDYREVWTDEDLRTLPDTAPVNGTFIKNLLAVYQSFAQIDVSFDVEFTADQIAILKQNQDYLLYFTTHDQEQTAPTGNKVTGRIDVNYYNKNSDVSGLFDFDTFTQYPHPLAINEVGFTNAKTFNESAMMAKGRFWVLNEATLNDLKFDITVYKSDDTWDSLRSLVIDLSEQTTVNGIQQIELDSTRGYILADNDIFNYLKVTTDTNDGTKQYYDIEIGYRMPWQSWLKFDDAPATFYDKTKSHNGLNQKASNYSMVDSDYGIKVLFDALVDSTNYVKTSEEIEVHDYDSTVDFTCEIQTYKKNELGEIVPIAGNIIQEGYTQLQAKFAPSVPPTFTQPVDFTDVSENWNRFAHGNLKTVSTIRRNGIWANEQANDTDTFEGTGGTPIIDKNDPSLYTTLPTEILANENLAAFYGCYSIDKYEYYSISGLMAVNTSIALNDNDVIGFNVAVNVDEDGIEHTLSLLATTGGVLLDLNNTYVEGDSTTDVFEYVNTVANWALVYDFGKSGCKQLLLKETTKIGFTWFQTGDLEFTVNRSGNDFFIDVSWTIDTETTTETFNYNLNDDVLTEKFKGFSEIGFSFMSQDQGGFKGVNLTSPQNEFYSEMRIDPKESQSDFTDSRISSHISAPANGILQQITANENKATLSWDGTNFIAQCLIDTTQVTKGSEYDFSAELRPLDLEQI